MKRLLIALGLLAMATVGGAQTYPEPRPTIRVRSGSVVADDPRARRTMAEAEALAVDLLVLHHACELVLSEPGWYAALDLQACEAYAEALAMAEAKAQADEAAWWPQ